MIKMHQDDDYFFTAIVPLEVFNSVDAELCESNKQGIKTLLGNKEEREYLISIGIDAVDCDYFKIVLSDLIPCPFCGSTPKLPTDVIGTQYEMYCEGCGLVCCGYQIADLMAIEERLNDGFVNHRYKKEYIKRAEREVIKQWQTRF